MMSSGGDEVNLPCWEEDEDTQHDLAERNITIADALNEFVQTVQGVIRAHGKTPFIKSGEHSIIASPLCRYNGLGHLRYGLDAQRACCKRHRCCVSVPLNVPILSLSS